ncbi:hypothetical protein LOTGIDRAFT_228659 [Lottia gigantea]|uniref:Ig-like domain-containing protein n=1 Tax=Lottia gigantea TaxID=225164 RepID=V4BXZ7_LOTGI|nr:hypothetical protein LOTGIDRAFT_228659 [Lottia gigantea]ESO93974.1 hypothetical protein LOTGIDRAFT_228659 [Lottia gigantea]
MRSFRAQDPEIVDEIWPEVKPIGRTGRLNCTVANKEPHVVQWTLLGQEVEVISQDESIYIMNPIMGGLRKYEVQVRQAENRMTYMLIIRRLREQNAGTYECSVLITGADNTKWPKKLGLLTVQVSPTIRPGDTDTIVQADPGSNTTLTCAATGIPAPNITWTRSDGGQLPDGSAQRRGAVLPLINVTPKMSGLYRCVADNNIKPPADHLAEVLIFNSPRSRVVQNSVGQALGGRYNAKLECIVAGYPEPSVTFARLVGGAVVQINDNDDFVINKQTTDNQNLYAQEQWYTLQIKNVKAGHFTDYYCIAKNPYGEYTSTISLFETTECQGPNCPSFPSGGADFIKISTFAILLPIVSSFLFLHN